MRFAYITSLESTSATETLHRQFAQDLTQKAGREFLQIDTLPTEDIEEWLEQTEVDLLFVSCQNKSRVVQRWLNRLRELRIPYMFLTDTMQKVRLPKILLLPVSMLEEEVYKAHISANIARFTGAETVLLKAHDYGSKAMQNTQKIQTVFEQFGLPIEVQEGHTDSFHVAREAVERHRDFTQDMLVLTASRDYGLDDIIFGPIERHCIMQSRCPVLLVNPRGDLFALCD